MRTTTERLRSFVVAAALALPAITLLAIAPARADESSAFEAAARVFAARCTACHAGARPEGQLRLERGRVYRETVNVPARGRRGLLLVDPGAPDRSALYLKLLPPDAGSYRGPRMPMHEAPLAADELAAIRAWILAFPQGTWGGGPAGVAPDPLPVHGDVPPPPVFPASHLANLPTPDTLGAKGLELRIVHRFRTSTSDAGSRGAFGLDGGANIALGVAAGLGERFDVGVSRTNLDQSWELYAKWLALRQAPAGPPLSLALYGSVIDVRAPDRENRRRVALQAIAGRRFGERLSLMLVPTLVTHTHTFDANDRRGTAALGLGGAFRLNSYLSLTGEWVAQTGGVEAPFQSATLGFEVATSRHTFHLLLSNTAGTLTDQYVPGGDLELRKHAFRLGFNITRTFDRAAFRPQR